MTRWIIIFFLIAAVGLAALIWIDSSPAPDRSLDASAPESPYSSDEQFTDYHTGVDFNDPEKVWDRIEQLIDTVSVMEYDRAAVPFFGELMLLFTSVDRKDGAANASYDIGMILQDPDDLWNAGVLYYQWAMRQDSEEQFRHYLDRSHMSFTQASSLQSDPAMRTDHALVLHLLGESEEALDQLRLARIEQDDYYKAFLYTGVILYETGEKEESISYINQSIEMAADEEERALIRELLYQSSIEI